MIKKINSNVHIIDEKPQGKLLEKIEKVARTCYQSEGNIQPGSAVTLVSNLIKRGHEAMLEHDSISVRIICDRGVSHEIVRHRIASYAQESTRYCNYTGDKFGNQITVIDIATGFKYDLTKNSDIKKYEIWNRAMEQAAEAYFEMMEAGATPEEARSVLPNSLKTEIVVTMNLRAWRNFFKLRCDYHAHPQMREVADNIYDLFLEKYPIFFEDLEIQRK